VFSRPLALLSAVLTGLLAGGMILVEVVLLPFWRSASPAEFRDWFTAHSGRIRGLMVPLGAGTGTAVAASVVAQLAEGRRSAPASVAAALATAGVIGITATVNEPANRQFTAGTLTDPQTSELLGRWAWWHHLRVVLGLAAAVGACSALSDGHAAAERARAVRLIGRRPTWSGSRAARSANVRGRRRARRYAGTVTRGR
jgi:hypothetical protein